MGNVREGHFYPGGRGPRGASRAEDQREDAEEQDRDDKSQQEFRAIVFQPPEAYLENRPNHLFRIRMTKTKKSNYPVGPCLFEKLRLGVICREPCLANTIKLMSILPTTKDLRTALG